MNKGRRNELAMLKYKKRIHRFVRRVSWYTTRTGEVIQNPKAIHVINDNGQCVYKTSSTPCSCMFCQDPERNYNRAKIKKQTRSEIIADLTYQGEGGEQDKAWQIYCQSVCDNDYEDFLSQF